MEEGIFRRPAVAGILGKSYVEARLHTDGEAHIDRILELQQELTRSVATPYYVVVDPSTGARRGRFEGSTHDAEQFASFLERGLERGLDAPQ